jgi:hypothetical protein
MPLAPRFGISPKPVWGRCDKRMLREALFPCSNRLRVGLFATAIDESITVRRDASACFIRGLVIRGRAEMEFSALWRLPL